MLGQIQEMLGAARGVRHEWLRINGLQTNEPQNIVLQNWIPQNWIPQNWILQNWIPQNWILQNWIPQNWILQNWILQNWIPQNWILQNWIPQNWILQNNDPQIWFCRDCSADLRSQMYCTMGCSTHANRPSFWKSTVHWSRRSSAQCFLFSGLRGNAFADTRVNTHVHPQPPSLLVRYRVQRESVNY
jgi:hypothetical protein